MLSAAALPCNGGHSSGASEEPPAKRPKTLACLRCRRRKQKCDDERPCGNCSRSGEECQEAPSRPYWQPPPMSASNAPNGLHPPLALLGDLASLEERVSHLERTRASELNNMQTSQQKSHHCAVARATAAQTQPNAPNGSQASHVSSLSGDAADRPCVAIGRPAAQRPDTPSDVLPSPFHEPFAMHRGAAQSLMPPSSLPELPCLDQAGKDMLFRFYYERVQTRYPFLRLERIQEAANRGRREAEADPSLAFFAHMIFSISLLLGKTSEFLVYQARQEDFYRVAVYQYLPAVLSRPDRVVHIQAYLLLAMHALYSPSTEKLISITSTAMRYCIMGQLHLADAEPVAADVAGKVAIQMRRRVFWSAYGLDRAVGTMFHLPFGIPDYQITTKMYANVDDPDLDRHCAAAFPDDPRSQPAYTPISAALHIVYCRQIQSEILNTTLHRDYFEKEFDRLSSWRRRILEKLDRWKSLCHRYTQDGARLSLVHIEWLHIIYNYSLQMLYQPNRQTAAGPAGDWTVQACIQTILIFRKFQRESAISVAWMGLIAQFKSGVALLYCFWATTHRRQRRLSAAAAAAATASVASNSAAAAAAAASSTAYDASEASEAVRCCSIVLSLMAERWPTTKCLRDAFDILAREVPLVPPLVPLAPLAVASASSVDCFPARQPLSPLPSIRPASGATLLALLPQIEAIVIHRDTLRMIREMATEREVPVDGSSRGGGQPPPYLTQAAAAAVPMMPQAVAGAAAEKDPTGQNHILEMDESPMGTALTGDLFQPVTPHFFTLDTTNLDTDDFDYGALGFPGVFDPHMVG